jgi:WS/DGAT/MGAT family acyltransferase
MSDAHVNECLSFADAFFLYLEQPGAPLNVAAISAFEGEIPLAACMEYVNSKLALIPRFLHRVVMPPLNIGPPTLQYDAHFDIRNHVREIKLKHGTDTEWKAAVSEILSSHLNRSRPLWDITLIHGLNASRTGLVIRMHHCLVDGVAGVGLLGVLLDQSPVMPARNRKRPRVPAPPPRDPGTVLLDTLINSCFTTGQAFLTIHSELLRMAEQAAHPHGSGTHSDQIQDAVRPLAKIAPLGDLARLISELAKPTQRLPYNVLCRGPQKFDWTEIPMAEIAAVRQACDATVNEVVLTVLSAALRRYAELHKVKTKGRRLRLVIPVNIRGEGESSIAGNQITFLPVDIPFNGREPRKLLSLVQKRVKFSKTAHAAELVTLAGMLIAATPPPLQSLTGSVLSQLPISVCNSICTNVHGPKTPLYLLGHKLLSTYPCVPIGGEMGMNCAVMSYNGTLFVGFTGDALAIPDLSSLAAFFSESFAELRDAVVVQSPKSKQPRRKPKVAINKPRPAPIPSDEGASNGNAAFGSETEAIESPAEAMFA